jgi:hypothetical protein
MLDNPANRPSRKLSGIEPAGARTHKSSSIGAVRSMSVMLRQRPNSAAQRDDAMCQLRTRAPQQSASLFDYFVSGGEQIDGSPMD